ncbi:hypothetical protein DOTSEDRAFT_49301 [Dothistroma septosporum NZE10]|uniref:GPI transamidase component PIG-S n=1 Tax=Dothistroma septosporum (strain NZE10 / CBS 128990) TaxID=675120 RepID=N1PZR5_DOTSN|nr:hypothetical protein DOTSEDRAFT_49301 [Dothistroma septosporum NZE10]
MDATGTSEVEAFAHPDGLPAEKLSSVWTRRLIIIAFWAVVVCFGLPHWTWTTSIHRSALPLESMGTWAEGKACQLHYPLYLNLQTPDLDDERGGLLASGLQQSLDAHESRGLHDFHVSRNGGHLRNGTSDGALTVILNSASTVHTPQLSLKSWEPVLNVQYSIQTQVDISKAATFIATEISHIFQDESASLWHLVKDTPYANGLRRPAGLSREQASELDRRTTRAFKYAPTYHLTFSLFTQAATPSAWQIDEALHDYIQPLLSPLSAISDFTIDTQVQLFASLSPSIPGPVFDDTKNQWRLDYADLTGFVNAAEWPLNPSIGEGPTINFVLYVPAPDKRPLAIDDNGGSSWIIPQWGGVQIHNSVGPDSSTLTLDDLRPDMLVFADQLAALIGVPQYPSSLSLRISSLARERATALILSASSTLGALSRLTLKLQSIAIPGTVAKAVDETLLRLDNACSDLRQGRFQSALENARTAETEVEKAFFEPSMVGQVYFPEEHKVAVYVPLLGPMAVPLVMSGLKELKKLRDRKQKAA